MKEINFKISYHNGEASNGRLDMYDASISLQGFAKAISITTHALLNNGQIRRRADGINGAELYINPSKKGSFEELITLAIKDPFVQGIGGGVIANVFYDILKRTWSKTLNLIHEPETPFVRSLEERNEPFLDDIEEALEIPLKQAHRPIEGCDNMIILIKRRRLGEVIAMNNDTLKSVSISTEADKIFDVIGNVTRYNILSGVGRLYDDAEGRTISFKVKDDASDAQRSLITESLHNAQTSHKGKLSFKVRRVVSAKGVVRRYLVEGVEKPKP